MKDIWTVPGVSARDRLLKFRLVTSTKLLFRLTGDPVPSVIVTVPLLSENVVGSLPLSTTSSVSDAPLAPTLGVVIASALRTIWVIWVKICWPCVSTSAIVWFLTLASSNVQINMSDANRSNEEIAK